MPDCLRLQKSQTRHRIPHFLTHSFSNLPNHSYTLQCNNPYSIRAMALEAPSIDNVSRAFPRPREAAQLSKQQTLTDSSTLVGKVSVQFDKQFHMLRQSAGLMEIPDNGMIRRERPRLGFKYSTADRKWLAPLRSMGLGFRVGNTTNDLMDFYMELPPSWSEQACHLGSNVPTSCANTAVSKIREMILKPRTL